VLTTIGRSGLRVPGLDAQRGGFGLLRIVHERQAMLVELHALELGQDAVADRLRRNTSGIGDVENGSPHTCPEGHRKEWPPP
jgi:hypothetical protein